MPADIQVVFFDAGGTLFRPYPSVGEVYARTAAKHGVVVSAGAVEEEFYRHWHERSGLASLTGQTSEKIERDWWYALVRDIFGNLPAFADFDGFFEELYDLFAQAESWRLYDDTVPALQALKGAGYRLAIISNWDRRLFSIVEQLGLRGFFEHITASAVAGIAKPGRGIFEQALAAMRVVAANALHTGDSLNDDYRGAMGAGLEAVFLDRAHRAPKDVPRIGSLEELLPLLSPAGDALLR